MIKSVELCLKHERLIDSRKKFVFQSGYTAIIGPNGSGKSSLLRAIQGCDKCEKCLEGHTRVSLFDSELMNPHRFEEKFQGVEGSLIKVRAMFSSHGETMRDVLKNFQFKKGDVFLLDEPESGQDLGWMMKIRKGLNRIAKEGCQVIVSTHHPVFWTKTNQVISLKTNYAQKLQKDFKNLSR
ncbi:MAG: AAA family ATPase [Candidatus Omnitrophica bacterium]|nr:AAA family ATPase [Candidatus Omnitrophota bacterium]